MKKLLFAVVAMIVFSMNAMAQNENQQQGRRGMSKEEMVKFRTDRMQQHYGLSDAQTAKVLELNTKYMDKLPLGGRPGAPRQGRRPAGGVDKRPQGNHMNVSPEQREARMKEMRANHEAYEKELQTILSEEQFAKYQEDMKNMRQRAPRNNRQNDAK